MNENYKNSDHLNHSDLCGVTVCENCHTHFSEEASFCPTCGISVSVNKYIPFVKKKRKVYLNKFGTMLSNNSKASFNWCAFLFTPYWFVYRKMYSIGVLYIVIFSMLTVVTKFNISLMAIGLVLELTTKILLGVFANYIYMTHIDNWDRNLENHSCEEIYSDVNKTALIISIVCYAIIYLITNLI